MNKFIFLIGIVVSFGVSAKEIKDMKPAGNYCSRVTGLGQRLAEYIASTTKVSVNSVSLIRASTGTSGVGCFITVDTAIGPQSCTATNVYTDGKDFWVGGACY